MKALFLAATVMALTACANAPSSTSTSRSANWWDYRHQVMEERAQGTLTPLAAEEKLEAKYLEIYGPDPTMEGVFAYGKRLYAMADAGKLSIEEADALSNARMDEILARDAADVRFHSWLESRFPPNGGD
jgi:hypothetical protein